MNQLELVRRVKIVFSGVYLGEETLKDGRVKALIYNPRSAHKNKPFLYTEAYESEGRICFCNSNYELSWEQIREEVKTLRR